MRLSRALAMLSILALAGPARADLYGLWQDDGDLQSDFFGDLAERHRRIDAGLTDGASTRYEGRAPAETAPTSRASQTGPGQAVQVSGKVPDDRAPWSALWWPRRQAELSFLRISQGLSPLEKYDTFVKNRFGRNPGAALWEADPANEHNLGPVPTAQDWHGHCNGAAAASILVPEPPARISIDLGAQAVAAQLPWSSPRDVPHGISRSYGVDEAYRYPALQGGRLELTSDDVKGWLAETFMICSTLQFSNPDVLGTRSDSNDRDLRDKAYVDIHPHYFHWLLLEFLKNRGQPIVLEVDPHKPVNNHPAYAFESEGVQRPGVTSFRTKVWLTDYAPTYQFRGTKTTVKEYTYDLLTDEQGRVRSGRWTGQSVHNHPDFAWLPVGDRRVFDSRENSRLDPEGIFAALQYGDR